MKRVSQLPSDHNDVRKAVHVDTGVDRGCLVVGDFRCICTTCGHSAAFSRNRSGIISLTSIIGFTDSPCHALGNIAECYSVAILHLDCCGVICNCNIICTLSAFISDGAVDHLTGSGSKGNCYIKVLGFVTQITGNGFADSKCAALLGILEFVSLGFYTIFSCIS